MPNACGSSSCAKSSIHRCSLKWKKSKKEGFNSFEHIHETYACKVEFQGQNLHLVFAFCQRVGPWKPHVLHHLPNLTKNFQHVCTNPKLRQNSNLVTQKIQVAPVSKASNIASRRSESKSTSPGVAFEDAGVAKSKP